MSNTRFRNPLSGVRIEAFAHREARSTCPVCESRLLHTAKPEAPVRCANRPFYTPRSPKHLSGVRIDPFTHRKARSTCPVCESTLLHTAKPETPSRCANRPFYTPQSPKPRPGARNCLNAVHAVQSAQPEAPRKTLAPPIGVRISPFAHRKALAQKYVNSSGTA